MIRLALLDDHGAVPVVLRRLVETDAGVELLAAAPDPGSLARALAGRRPDVLVVDDDPVRGDALAVCRRLKARPGAPAVLLYTGRATPGLVIAARAAGADGVVERFAPPARLSSAIRRLAAGERVLPAVSRRDYELVVERLTAERPAALAALIRRTPRRWRPTRTGGRRPAR